MEKSPLPPGALLLCLSCLHFSGACGHQPVIDAKASAVSAPSTVAVAKVKRGDLARDVVLTAEFKPFQEVEVMAKVAGYVKKIEVDVGDRVKQGQLLAA